MTVAIADRLRAGARRHAGPVLGGLVLLAALALLPDFTPPTGDAQPLELVRGRIVDIQPGTADPGSPDARVEIVGGDRDGEVVEAFLQGPSGQQEIPRYDIGDEVVVSVFREGAGEYVAVTDRWRGGALALVVGLFALAVTAVGGWRGLRSLIGLALTLGVVVKVVVPLLLAGWSPVPLAVGAAAAVTVATFLLTEGARRSTAAASIGTFGALTLTALLAVAFNAIAEFTELQGAGDIVYLQTIGRPDLDLGGLLLAAVIFGALGVLDDVTITQAATVHELYEADPYASRWRLAGRAMNVGRSHIAATVNTLVLAYVGASLPLLVLFAAGGQDLLLTASGEVVAVEVVKSLAGSIGIVAAVPLTTAVAVAMAGRKLPLVGNGSGGPAPGWG